MTSDTLNESSMSMKFEDSQKETPMLPHKKSKKARITGQIYDKLTQAETLNVSLCY
jgi:hypothetical protein